MICPDCGAGEQRESDTQCSQCGEALLLHARYQLLAVLGSNIGTTYLARDTTAGREVVVKELAFGKLDAWKTQELFEREMQVLRQLDHPLIPSYLEHFTLGQGKRQRNYLVLERVQGETLRDELEHRRYSEDDVLDVLDRVLSVLEYLQALHPPLIHRDIKPSNLIRMPDGRIALVDFGAVRDLLRGEGDTPTIAGTFGFMAPEQFRSEAFLQTDLYGLGGVALHLLARKPPDKMLASSMQLDWQRHVNVSPPMRALLERLLALEVSARPASASAARQLVAETRAGAKAGSAGAAGARAHAGKAARTSNVMAVAIIALVLAIGSGAALLLTGGRAEPRAPQPPAAVAAPQPPAEPPAAVAEPPAPAPFTPIAPDPPLVTTASRALSRAQIQRAMRAIMPAVRRCYDKYKLQGVALIQMQVLQSGRVTYARVKGKFLGTSMGTCIAEAARTARFPRFDGKPLKFIYPVILR